MRIDIGCGPNKKEGFIGVDVAKFPGVDEVCQVGVNPLPFADGSVEEVHASHFMEHLRAHERMFFANDLYRVMKPGAKATIIVPHWNSNRAYGDMTHQWPPVSEMFFYYLKREWREANAPHTDKKFNPEGMDCDFDATWGYSVHGALLSRNIEFQQFAMTWYKEAVQDIHATLTRR
jgi:SAM-dependent methyltransferase